MMLSYKTSGQPANPSILFLHGGGLSGKMWDDVTKLLQEHYYCIVPDLPGHGDSSSITPLTADKCVEELTPLLSQYGPVHIVGLSMGGILAQKLIEASPDSIRSVIITGSSPQLSSFKVALINMLVAPTYRFMSSKKMTASMMKGLSIPAVYAHDIELDMEKVTPSTMRQMYGLMKEIKVPTPSTHPLLVLAGEREGALVRNNARKLLAALPNSKGALVPGLNHAWSYENPQLFAEVVRTWIVEGDVHEGLIRFI